jgi:hypothetical protein
MKTFVEQLQEYVSVSKSEKLNRQRFLKRERVKYLDRMFDLLQILGVVKEVKSSHPFSSCLEQYMLAHILVNKYYKDLQ